MADSSWCSPETSRRALVGELCRRLDLFRNQDLGVTTLVLSDTDVGRHVEALPKAGFRSFAARLIELDQPSHALDRQSSLRSAHGDALGGHSRPARFIGSLGLRLFRKASFVEVHFATIGTACGH